MSKCSLPYIGKGKLIQNNHSARGKEPLDIRMRMRAAVKPQHTENGRLETAWETATYGGREKRRLEIAVK